MDAASYLSLSEQGRAVFNEAKIRVYDDFAFAEICQQLEMEPEEFEDLTTEDTDDRWDVHFYAVAKKLKVRVGLECHMQLICHRTRTTSLVSVLQHMSCGCNTATCHLDPSAPLSPFQGCGASSSSRQGGCGRAVVHNATVIEMFVFDC